MTESDLSLWWTQSDEPEIIAPLSGHHHVSLVVINRNGIVWQPDLLKSIGWQSRRPDFSLVADCASTDSSTEGFGEEFAQLPVQPDQTFGQILNSAIAALPEHADRIEWVWLLHDDSAPYAHSLAELLRAAEANPAAAVLGSKLVDWRNPDHVIEIGSRLTGIGTRFSDLEVGERDQGQHDDIEPALVVNTAGMLIRKDVWRSLGGFDQVLPHFRVDAEFCLRVWESGNQVISVPRSRVRHVAATARGVRRPTLDKSSAHYQDRRAGMLLVLARTSPKLIWLRLALMILAGAIRGLGYLALQDFSGARDEWRAALSLVFNPLPIQKLRAARGALPIPRDLKPTLKEQGLHVASELGTAVSNGWVRILEVLFPAREQVAEVGRVEALRAILRRPGSLLTIVTLAFGFGLSYPLLGSGQLVTPAGVIPTSSADLLAEFYSNLHAVGLGSEIPAHPMQFILAVAALLTGGNPDAFVTRLLVLAPWLAAISMHLSLRTILRNAPTRVWLAAIYGLAPGLAAAIVGGEVGVVLVAVLLPPFLVLVNRPAPTWRQIALASLLLSIFISVWPAFWLAVLVAVVGFLVFMKPTRDIAGRFGVLLVLPVVVLTPWSLSLITNPTAWFNQFGNAGELVPLWQAVLATGTSGAGFGWWWNFAFVALAFATLLDRRKSELHTRIWSLIALLLAIGFFGQSLATAFGDPGIQTSLTALSAALFALLVVSYASAANFLSINLQKADFGWRQITTIVAVIAISAMPLAGIYSALQMQPTQRAARQVPVTQDELRGFSEDLRLRSLYFETAADGTLRTSIFDERVVSFGDLEVAQSRDVDAIAQSILNWLTLGNPDDTNVLRDFGIGYIATPFQDPSEKLIATRPNLERLITARNSKLLSIWRVTDVTARAYVLDPAADALAIAQIDLNAPTASLTGLIPVSANSRTLQLAERSSARWIAELDGVELTPKPGLIQSWKIPPNAGGDLVISYQDEVRLSFLLIAGSALALTLLMIAPRRKHIYRDEWMSE